MLFVIRLLGNHLYHKDRYFFNYQENKQMMDVILISATKLSISK